VRRGGVWQNGGAGFRRGRGQPNGVAPRKRRMHTIIPGMVRRDGRAVMPYGVMGGYFQPMGHSLFLANLLEYGLDMQEAIDHPRLLPRGGAVQVERGIAPEVCDRLSRLGHKIALVDKPHGGGQAIWIDRARGCLIGANAGIGISLTVPDESPQTFGYTGLAFVTAYALGAGVREAVQDVGGGIKVATLTEVRRRLLAEVIGKLGS